jgi:hypothetical protein
VPGLMADNDIEGQFQVLLSIFRGEEWNEIWTAINLTIQTFETLGLSRHSTDAVVWHACQQHQVVLVTSNRNNDGPDSLQATIRGHNMPTNLPVFTVANSRRLSSSRTYAERVAERILEYLLDLESIRGTGRIYVP